MANNAPILKKKNKPKSDRPIAIGKWQKNCDTLMQQKYTALYPRCEVCGKPVSCMHHFFPKSVSARLRYEKDNLIPICQGCHSRHHQAGDPRIHAVIIEKRGGMRWYRTLLRKKNEEVRVNIGYYKQIYEELTKL